MFDLEADDGSVRRRRYKSPIPTADSPDPAPIVGNVLDSPKMLRMHKKLLNHYLHELDRQHDNRITQAIEEDFYDNIQWREEDAQALEERGQVPLVFNVISASIDWVLGTERRTRTDYKVLPRRKEEGKPADRKSQLLKYLSDVNRTPFHVSRAFADGVKVGVGWMEDGWGDGDDEEPIYSRYENWRNILWDSASTELDLKDARYVYRSKWTDLDIACAMFPKRARILERSVRDADMIGATDTFGDAAMDQPEDSLTNTSTSAMNRDIGYSRQRLRLMEGWFRIPVQCGVIQGGTFDRELFDPYSPGHVDSINSGEADFTTRVRMRMFVGIFSEVGLVYFGPSPYRHNRFPFTPIWGKRRGRDQMPYGMIRGVKDIQEDVNKRASKALHILSSNKVIIDETTIPDDMTQEEFAEEASRPDAFLVKKKGSELVLDADRELGQWQIELMSRNIQMIQQASGVTDELLGRETGAKSGIAIERRQDQGSLATSGYFDNLRLASQVSGEKKLSLVEQFMKERKAFRITNVRGKPEYIEVNDGLPENDVVRSKADFIISDADWQASQRQAAVSSLFEVMAKFPPEISLLLLDMVVEDMDLPHREEIVRRIRSVTGQRDPDAEEPTPEEQQQMQAASQKEQMQQEMFMATLKKLLADTALTDAQAADVMQRVKGAKVDMLIKALNAAQSALAVPASAHVADHILTQTGAVDAPPPMGLPAPDTMPPPPPPAGAAPLGLGAAA